MSVNEIEKKIEESVQKFRDRDNYYVYGDERDWDLAVLTGISRTPLTDPKDIEKRKIGIGIEDLAQVMQSVGHSLKEIDDVVTAALKEIITSE